MRKTFYLVCLMRKGRVNYIINRQRIVLSRYSIVCLQISFLCFAPSHPLNLFPPQERSSKSGKQLGPLNQSRYYHLLLSESPGRAATTAHAKSLASLNPREKNSITIGRMDGPPSGWASIPLRNVPENLSSAYGKSQKNHMSSHGEDG